MHFIFNFFFQKLELICHTSAFMIFFLNLTVIERFIARRIDLPHFCHVPARKGLYRQSYSPLVNGKLKIKKQEDK